MEEQSAYDLADRTLPENFVVISLAKFSDEHYGLKAGHVQVQALGNWERGMAPPSILEFIIVLLMRQAASFINASLSKSVHLGTKGCLFDFTADIAEARYKALQSFVCTDCRARMHESGSPHLAHDLANVLDLNLARSAKRSALPGRDSCQPRTRSFLDQGNQTELVGKHSINSSR